MDAAAPPAARAGWTRGDAIVDRLTRVTILFSALAALAVATAFGVWYRADHRYAALIATLVGLCVGWVRPAAGHALVLAAAPVMSALLNAATGMSGVSPLTVWIGALLGLLVSEKRLRGWSLPHAWRVPLGLWGLCLSVAWPIVVAREADFSLAQLYNVHSPVTGLGVAPPVQALWVAHITAAQLAGLLWLDALFASFAGKPVERFEREIVWPAAAGILASIAVGVYQTTVDVTALNPTVYGVLGRAAGLTLDGNVFGTLSAMWAAGLVALALGAGGASRLIAAVGIPAAFVAVWGSGSRTALLAAMCGAVGVLWAVFQAVKWTRLRQLAVVGAVLVAVLVAAASSATVGPLGRIRVALDSSRAGNQGVVRYLWERDGFGSSAIRMIGDFPAFGVGVGAFHALVLDYSRAIDPASTIGPDNAQNWFRHQIAELGIVGSLGWMAFAAVLITALARPPTGPNRARALVVAAAIVGLGVASMLGMPTQHVVVLITFYLFVFWHHRLRAAPVESTLEIARMRREWMAVAIIVGVFAAGTLYSARTGLRVPRRAERFGWDYSYGFYYPEPAVDGSDFRWAQKRAVAVVEVPRPWMRLTIAVNHLDIANNPVDVRLWCDGRRVLDTRLASVTPVVRYVRMPNRRRVTLESWVSRVVRPRELGVADARELGLLVQWTFVDGPPPDAILAR